MEILDILTDVANTGRLGPVFIGADWADVTAALGEPRDVGPISRSRMWPRLFAYGDVELSVCHCRKVSLVCIQAWHDVIELPAAVVGATGTFPAAVNHSDLVSALDKADCPWQPLPSADVRQSTHAHGDGDGCVVHLRDRPGRGARTECHGAAGRRTRVPAATGYA
ncbi:hypothetical protein ACWGCW_05995 [Streptomyces sp. NPDC054933]